MINSLCKQMFLSHNFRYDLFDLKVTDVKIFFEIEED